MKNIRTLWRVAKFFFSTSAWLSASVIILGLVAGSLLPFGVALSKLLVDGAVQVLTGPLNPHLQSYLLSLVLVYAAILMFSDLSATIGTVASNVLGDKLLLQVAVQMIQKIMRFPDLELFESKQRRREVNMILNGSGWRPVTMLQAATTSMRSMVSIVWLLILLSAVNPWVAAAMLLTGVPFFWVQFKIEKATWDSLDAHSTERLQMFYYQGAAIHDTFAKEIRLQGTGSFFLNRYVKAWTAAHDKLTRVRLTKVKALVAVAAVAGLAMAACFVYTINLLWVGRLSPGEMAVFIGAIVQLRAVLAGLISASGPFFEGLLFFERFFCFLDVPVTMSLPLPPQARKLPVKLAQGIAFDRVSFRYPGSDQWALRDVSFEIRPSECVALVGFNGAGKTTMVKLMTRLYDPSQGRILVDGHDLKEYDLEDYRSKVSVTFQDFVKYEMTVNENVAVGDIAQLANEPAIEVAVTQAGVQEVVTALPQGYEQMLGRLFGGVDLSGGEWQKLAMARALLRDARILIMDEPTAALDALSEVHVFGTLREVIRDKMSLIISHRFSTVKMADRILVLDNGQIVEQGSHAELMDLNDRYAELFRAQAERYL